MRIFPYTTTETNYLACRDECLARFIHKRGHIEREADVSLFSSIVHQIIAQQISNKAQAAVWGRVQSALQSVTAQKVDETDAETLHSMGLSMSKVHYIKGAASKVLSGECDLCAIAGMTDEDAVLSLTSLKGVGVWTAQMVLLFGLLRPNVLSKSDAGIRRGIEIIYGAERGGETYDALFNDVRLRLSPYCSVASLYFWEAAGGFGQ